MATPLRVLIVENHAPTRLLLEMLLSEAGYAVTTTEDGRSALLRLVRERPDIVLTDLRMPLLDGNGLVQQIRADPALRDVAVVAVTAHADYATAGFDALVRKPFDAEDLLRTLDGVMRRPAAPT